MFVTIEDIYTHLYNETIEAISGQEKADLEEAILSGMDEVKGLLYFKYDVDLAFRESKKNRNNFLLTCVKDCAVWHYINKANPNVDYEIREKRYDIAIERLKMAQNGDFEYFIPLKKTDLDGDGIPDQGGVYSGSNPKRCQHY